MGDLGLHLAWMQLSIPYKFAVLFLVLESFFFCFFVFFKYTSVYAVFFKYI